MLRTTDSFAKPWRLAALLAPATVLLVGCIEPLDQAGQAGRGDSEASRVTGAAGSGADEFAGLTFREYVEAHGWTCGETTCEIASQGVPQPDVVFEPFEPAPEGHPAWLPDAPDGVGVVGAELQTNETTVLSSQGLPVHYSEPDAVFYRPDGSGAHSMNVFANQSAISGPSEATTLAHGCSTDYNTWCMRRSTVSQSKASDPAAIFESSGTNFLHLFTLNTSGTGFSWYSQSGQVCPSNCAAETWTNCALGLPTGVTSSDFPQALYLPDSDRKYLVYSGAFNGTNKIIMKRMNNGASCGTNLNRVRQCAGSNSEFFGRADYDNAGIVHVVYFDFSNGNDMRIRYTTYDTNTETWSCSNTNLAQFVRPTGATCGGTPTYTGVGTAGTLRNNGNATIAVDDTATPWATINVAFASNVTGVEARTFWLRKVADVWTTETWTSANSYHPRIVFDKTPVSALAGRYHTISLWDVGTQVQAVSWRSTDGGNNWTGTFIGSAYTPVGLNCYWGDYEAIAPDRTNAGVFYGWTMHSPSIPWLIRGRIINE